MTDIVVDLFEIENVNTVCMDDDHFWIFGMFLEWL
jgi:hypothetical protein